VSRRGTWRSDARGAAYVEFIIAILPMLILFWGIMQLNGLLLADLVVRHAAVHAVRAAIVCDSQVTSAGGPQSKEQLEQSGGCSWEAANLTLGAIKSFGATPDFTVDVEGASPSGNAKVTATVSATYRCSVPLVGSLVCGGLSVDGIAGAGGGSTIVLKREASLPNQGAHYKL
jgi:Flp pilus assembly protein TadG